MPYEEQRVCTTTTRTISASGNPATGTATPRPDYSGATDRELKRAIRRQVTRRVIADAGHFVLDTWTLFSGLFDSRLGLRYPLTDIQLRGNSLRLDAMTEEANAHLHALGDELRLRRRVRQRLLNEQSPK
jgi:hypothetical protein